MFRDNEDLAQSRGRGGRRGEQLAGWSRNTWVEVQAQPRAGSGPRSPLPHRDQRPDCRQPWLETLFG